MSEKLTLADIHPFAFYRAGDFAEVFDLNVDSVYRMLKVHRLSGVRVGPSGGGVRIQGQAFFDYAKERAA
jgi:hypothetical protein